MTVLISVNGLFLMGVAYLRGVALATSLAVLVVMAAAVTLLPALLSLAGRRVDRLRIPGLGRLRDRTPAAARWARAVQRRPCAARSSSRWPCWPCSTAPAHDAAPRLPGRRQRPRGLDDPRRLRPGRARASARAPTARCCSPARATAPTACATPSARGATAAWPSCREPQCRAGRRRALRDRSRPSTSPQSRGDRRPRATRCATRPAAGRAWSAAPTAAFVDQSELVAGRLPLFIGGVVGLSFLLLLCAFRSPLIALKAGVMNLLSVGAAYGVIALFAEGGLLRRADRASTPTRRSRPSSR